MPKSRNQSKKPMTAGERQKKYQKKLLKRASSTDAVTRRRAQTLLKKQKLRKKEKRTVLNGSKTERASTVSTINWLADTRRFATSRIRTHLRHAFAPPLVVNGSQQPQQPNLLDRDVWFKDDGGVFRLWLHRRPSKILNAGSGLFAARSFLSGSIVTKYSGKTTRKETESVKWQIAADTKGYVFQFKDNHGPIWVVPNSHCFYGHFTNHAAEPNCEIDARSGIICAKFDIPKNTELTLDYGTEYVKTWLN
jgi:hypothetical protein